MSANKFSIEAIIRAVDKFSPTMKRMAANMDHFGKLAKNVGGGMTTNLSVPIAAFGGLTLKTAVGFEAAMNKVEALSGETGASLDAMRQMAENLGATTSFSASEAADAMGFLSMAGWKANQVLAGTPAMLNLAAASTTSLGRTADIASNIMGQFGISAEGAAGVADILAATTSSANVDMEMMAQSLTSAGPIARAYGLTLENTAAAIGLLGNVGIQGDVAGTALKNTMLGMVSPASEAAKMLKWLGVQTKDAKGNMLPLVDVLASFGASLDKAGLGEGQKLQAIQTLFGKEGLAGATQLLSQAQSGALQQYADSLSNVEGRAKSMAETMMKGAPRAVKDLASAFESLMLSIAKSGLLEWFTNITNKITGLVRHLSNTNPALLRMGTVIAGIAAVAGPILWLIGGMATGIAALTTAFGALNLAMLANPFVLFAAAAAAAVYVIYDNWGGIVDWAVSKFDAIRSAFSDGLLKGLVNAFLELNPFNLMFEAIDGLISYMTGFDLSGFLNDQILSAVNALPNWAKDLLGVGDLKTSTSSAAKKAPADTRSAPNPGYTPDQSESIRRVMSPDLGGTRGGETRVVVSFEDAPAGMRVKSAVSQEDVALMIETAFRRYNNDFGSSLGVGRGRAFTRPT